MKYPRLPSLLRALVAPWILLTGSLANFAFAANPPAAPAPAEYDLVVFGASPAGLTAAIAAGRDGSKVLVVEPSYLIGGLMTGGLTKTDVGRGTTIGGIAREFYDRVLKHYTDTYGADSEQVKVTQKGYNFEPRIALQIFNEWLRDAGVTVRTKEQLEKIEVRAGRIVSFSTKHYESGATFTHRGKFFVDGTYEGDLMAQAGVLYRVGREARSEYNEPLAGITAGPAEYLGKGDHRVQAYNIRGTITDNPALLVPIEKPKNYYRDAHVRFIEQVNTHQLKTIDDLFPLKWRWAMINGKGDPNIADFYGANSGYSEGDYEQRARITAKVQDYWLSLWYMLQHDPELPEAFKRDARRYGLPKDEYAESNHVTPHIYVRVARRMLGRYFLTQHDVQYDRRKPDTICLGSYHTDCHPIQVIQTDDGPRLEGEFNGSADPYEIPYRSIVPYGVKNLLVVAAVSATHVAYSSVRMEPVFMMIGQAAGLAARLSLTGDVPVEQVPIAALQARLTAAGIPLVAPFRPVVEIKANTPPPYHAGQTVEFSVVKKQVESPLTFAWNFDGSGEVQATAEHASYTFKQPTKHTVSLLAQDGDRLQTLPARVEIATGNEPTLDRTVHHSAAKLTGRWSRTRGPEVEYRGQVGLGDEGKGDGGASAVFTTTLPKSGRYRVAIAFPSGMDRATNTAIEVVHAEGTAALKINQRKKPGPYAFQPLGEYRFTAGQPVTVTFKNQGADGTVLIDSVRWIWVGE
ncbi:FAD-dependent oxidoreductase [Oleiharenicola lentus]|uniref:FAD-dependent oxidoreductase n=1 Tax=Oleiharenicola lentus TaxID=2508720 RepID=UPI003F678A32